MASQSFLASRTGLDPLEGSRRPGKPGPGPAQLNDLAPHLTAGFQAHRAGARRKQDELAHPPLAPCRVLHGQTGASRVAHYLEELQQSYDDVTWVLGCGLIHGDARAENLIGTRDDVVLSDWDSASYGRASMMSCPPASGTG